MTRSGSVYITVHWVLTCLTGHVLHDEERLGAYHCALGSHLSDRTCPL